MRDSATLCRCGASKNKPYCDGSHREVGFSASGEPASGSTAALPVRDGPLLIDPQVDGPLQVRGHLAITSGTGRVVARASSGQRRAAPKWPELPLGGGDRCVLGAVISGQRRAAAAPAPTSLSATTATPASGFARPDLPA